MKTDKSWSVKSIVLSDNSIVHDVVNKHDDMGVMTIHATSAHGAECIALALNTYSVD